MKKATRSGGRPKSDKPKGRPTKLNADKQSKILEAVREGLPYTTACALAGIHYSTFAEWKLKGEQDPESVYADFAMAVKEAEAEAEAANVKRIRSAADNGQWQAAAWILERRHPDKWGRTDRQQVSGQVSIVNVDYSKLTDEQLERIANGESPASVITQPGSNR